MGRLRRWRKIDVGGMVGTAGMVGMVGMVGRVGMVGYAGHGGHGTILLYCNALVMLTM